MNRYQVEYEARRLDHTSGYYLLVSTIDAKTEELAKEKFVALHGKNYSIKAFVAVTLVTPAEK